MSDRQDVKEKLKFIFTYLDESLPDFTLVSYISLLLRKSYANYINYLKTIQKSSFTVNDYDDVQVSYIILSLSLMYKNDDMQDFFYRILKEAKVSSSELQEFRNQINRLNDNITATQSGGGGEEIYKYLYYIGFIIAAAFYNYYLYNNGSIQTLQHIYTRGPEIVDYIKQTGCKRPNPSNIASILVRGTDNPELVKAIDNAVYCLTRPTILADKLSEIYIESENVKIINEMQETLQLLPGFPELTEPKETSKELVLFGKNLEEDVKNKLIVYNPDGKGMNLQETKKNLKLLARMPFDEFKLVFNVKSSELLSPTDQPIETPTYQSIVSFVSEVAGAIGELTPKDIRVGLSFQNTFLWALQDKIKKIEWEMQDIETVIRRQVYLIITEATRILSDISDIPSVLTYLFVLNTTAFYGILFLLKKRMRSNAVAVESLEDAAVESLEDAAVESLERSSRRRIENEDISSLADQLENLRPLSTPEEREGREERKTRRGGRRRKRVTRRKTYKRKHTRRKPKGKKARRVTRKY